MKIKLVKMACGENLKDYKDFDELVKKYSNPTLNSIAEELIKTCIMRNKYYFDGEYHQRGEYGSFVFEDEDGEQYMWMASMRYFGGIMADVWSKLDRNMNYDYMDFYMLVNSKDPKFNPPKSETEFLENFRTNYSVHCEKCGKDITWEEYVVNCGWCDECMGKSLDEYWKEVKERLEVLKKEHPEDAERLKREEESIPF